MQIIRSNSKTSVDEVISSILPEDTSHFTREEVIDIVNQFYTEIRTLERDWAQDRRKQAERHKQNVIQSVVAENDYFSAQIIRDVMSACPYCYRFGYHELSES